MVSVPLELAAFMFFAVINGVYLFFNARCGWNQLARHWRAVEPPRGHSLPWITGSVGRSYFRSGLNIRFDDSGVWVSTVAIYRPFHPPLFFPWSSIANVERMGNVFFESITIWLKHSEIKICIYGFGSNSLIRKFNYAGRKHNLKPSL
jgi:hypothetical protein